PQLRRTGVSKCARIDKQRLSMCRQFDCQGVGVSVSAIVGSVWATIKAEIVCLGVPAIAHDIVATVGKFFGFRCRFLYLDFIKGARANRAEQPERLLCESTRYKFVIATIKKHCSRRKRSPKIVCRLTIQIY